MPKKPPDPTPEEDAQQQAHQLAERRRFLKHAGAAGGLALASGYLAAAPSEWVGSLRDPTGVLGAPKEHLLDLGAGFAVESSTMHAAVGVARGNDVPAMVRAAVDAIGGIGRFINSQDVVVIKPNVAFERAAPLGATTSPEVLAALIHLVRDAGAKEVRVADNPIESPEACFARSGLREAASKAGARVILPTPNDFRLLQTPGARLIERWPFFYRPFIGATKVIGVAPCKDHNLCSASMTTKNWYGLLGGRRNQFHQDIHGIITDLALMMKPTFVVLDGVRVLFRSGPTGGSLADVKGGQTVAAATDSLALDAFGWHDLLDRGDQDLPDYFHQAEHLQLGNPRWQDLRVDEVQVG